MLLILPVLPNDTFGPYDVLNPHDIWLMVVLIVGIGLVGYFAYKILGEKASTVMGIILGGLISNLVFKAALADFIGSRLFGRMYMLFGLVLVGGLLVIWLWPADLKLF